MSGARVLIFANGILPDLERARRILHPGDLMVCADGGTRHARALGLTPAALVGDLDSVGQEDRTALASANVELVQYPEDKDETDLELALRYALQHDPSSIVVVGALGQRLDHTIGNISLLLDSRLIGRDCRLDDGVEQAFICRDRSRIVGAAGDLVSLVPWGGPAAGVSTDGLRWPLDGDTLHPERSRGISNEMQGDSASVWLESGLLLVIHRRR
jgi:thiamine pyrophosphokinase